nr:Spy/CpxP family protein refolding chaperone [uncultured Psychroserpens sp.]
MKKLILIAMAFVTLQAVAQDKQKEKRKAKVAQMKSMSAEDQATIATKKLTLALDLDEKQQSQVKEVMLEQAMYRKQKRDKKEQMNNAKGTNSTAKVQNVKEVGVKDINERLDHKIEAKKKMKSILNAEQYKKWEAMQGRRHMKAKEKNKMKSKH